MNPIVCFLLGVATLVAALVPIWFMGALVDKAVFDGWPWEDRECEHKGVFVIKPFALGGAVVLLGIVVWTLTQLLFEIGCLVAQRLGV